ncbi:hypothetical protein Tco_1454768 [Tanacetum coccineum]
MFDHNLRGSFSDIQGQIKILPPKSAKEILARERERKARTTLLMALPKDHLARFHNISDAKEMWDAIKTIFGGNAKNTWYKGRDQRTRKQEQPKALLTIDAGVINWSGNCCDAEEMRCKFKIESESVTKIVLLGLESIPLTSRFIGTRGCVMSEQDELPSNIGLNFQARLDGGQMARSFNNAQDSSALRSQSLPPSDWSMDIVAEFCGPSWWKELSKESGSKILPCGDGSCWKAFKPIASLIAKGKFVDPT